MGLSDLAAMLRERGGGGTAAEKEARRACALGREFLELFSGLRQSGAVADLEARLKELENALKNLDGRLVMGLLGGTGVGKSTLISAVAGEAISSSSVIRPTTTAPLVYRHADFPPLAALGGREVVHNIEALSALAIVDFPDFDSLETAHGQALIQNLPELDLVLWVTDYHKYADRRLYEVMRLASLGEAAQAAILNKRDEILAREDGEEALEHITGSFYERLREFGGWRGPPPWPVSAAEALAAPGDSNAGGLAPLFRLLDDLAGAKYRRAVEMGNLAAKSGDFKAALLAAARPQKWLESLKYLGRLKAEYRPAIPLEADLALLRAQNFLYVEPLLTAARDKHTGLLSLFTDFWDFAASRFRGAAPPPKAAPSPLAPAFARHLADWSEESALAAGAGGGLNEDEALKEGGKILEEALAHLAPPKPGSAALWLWPVIWAVLLVWAESGGIFTVPALMGAALRSAAPWLILAALGDLFLTGFIWFRARRALERSFARALDEAAEKLMELARPHVLEPIEEAEARLARILDLTADLEKDLKEST